MQLILVQIVHATYYPAYILVTRYANCFIRHDGIQGNYRSKLDIF